MYRLLRYSGALVHDAAVTEWFDARPPAFASTTRAMLARISHHAIE